MSSKTSIRVRSRTREEEISLTPYEGEESILGMWSEGADPLFDTVAIPAYFRSENSSESVVNIFDIRDELKGMSAAQLADVLPNLTVNYPRMSKRAVVLLWITVNKKRELTDREIDALKSVDPGTFSISQTAINAAGFAAEDAEKTRAALSKNAENFRTAYRKLEKPRLPTAEPRF